MAASMALSYPREFNIPVMLRPTTRVSHARADVEVADCTASLWQAATMSRILRDGWLSPGYAGHCILS